MRVNDCCRGGQPFLLILLLFGLIGATPALHAQGTIFTYQGRLLANGTPASGSFDINCSLFNVSSGTGQVGNTATNSAIAVSNGLFTVQLDFGANFSGANRWLEIAVRTNGGATYSTLVPRQLIAATPYAITAGTVTGTIPDHQLSGNIARLDTPAVFTGPVQFTNPSNVFSGTFNGNGANLTGLLKPTDYLTNLAYSSYKLSFPNLWTAMQKRTTSPIRILWLGDSTGSDTYWNVANFFANSSIGLQKCGYFQTYPNLYFTFSAANYGYQANASGTTDLNAMRLYYLTNGSATFQTGAGTGAVGNRLYAAYIQGPDAGIFTLKSISATATNTLATINASNTISGMTFTNIPVALDSYKVVITLTGGNKIGLACAGTFQTNINSALLMLYNSGGALLSDLYSNQFSFTNLLAATQPDAIIIQDRGNQAQHGANWITMNSMIRSVTTACDVIVVGQRPVSGDDNGTNGNDDDRLVNAVDRAYCASFGWSFLDHFSPFQTWSNIVALGFDGGEPHLNQNGVDFESALTVIELNLPTILKMVGR